MMNKTLLKDGNSEFQEDFTLQLLIHYFLSYKIYFQV